MLGRNRRAVGAARAAVSVNFLVAGCGLGAWAAHIPAIADGLALDAAMLGGILLAMALGSIAGLLAGAMTASHIGAAMATLLSGLLFSVALGLPAVAPSIVALAVVVVALGALLGALDVSMNTAAAAVERELGRPVMSSIHGFFSVGTLAGSAASGGLIAAGLSTAVAMAVVAAALAAMVLLSAPFLRLAAEAEMAPQARALLRLPTPETFGVGVLVLCAFLAEFAVYDWSALLLISEAGASAATAAYGIAAFAAAMAIGRFCGDAVVLRLGAEPTVRISAALFAAGMTGLILAPSPAIGIAALAVAGFGMANTVPILFSASTRLPGIAPATALAMVTTVGYGGGLLGPPLIGFVAEASDLGTAFLIIICCGAVVSIAARWMLPR